MNVNAKDKESKYLFWGNIEKYLPLFLHLRCQILINFPLGSDKAPMSGSCMSFLLGPQK